MQKTELIWLGQAFFKIVTPGAKVILIDPWKSFPPGNSLFPAHASINDADLILVTHGHFDHLGDTVDLAKSAHSKPTLKVVSIFEVMLYLLEQGVPQEKLQGLNKGGSFAFGEVSVTMVHAVHSAGIGGFGPQAAVNGGEAAGFVITLEDGTRIYHAGDTDVFSDMELLGKRFPLDVALLPIGGVFTMDPKGAAYAVSLLSPKLAIPMHFGGTFSLPGDPQEFANEVKNQVGERTRVVVPVPGEAITLK